MFINPNEFELLRHLDGPARTGPEADADARAAQAEPGPTPPLSVTLRKLGKRYGERVVLRGLDLELAAGEFVAVVGRSGCGKSIAAPAGGLEAPSGEQGGPPARSPVLFDGFRSGAPTTGSASCSRTRDCCRGSRCWTTWRWGCRAGSGRRPRRCCARLAWAIAAATGRRSCRADSASGSLARALVHRPGLLLLDEPLGALDALTRIDMQQLIETLWRRDGFTSVLVTHDVGEAVALADRILVLDEGGVALDERVPLTRPRARGSAAFAALEARVLRWSCASRKRSRALAQVIPIRHLKLAI